MSGLQGDHAITLLCGGEQLFPAMVEAIDAARVEVLLETYILDFNGSVLAVTEALARAAERGVAVCVVADGFGTPAIPEAWRQRWRGAGVRWRLFNRASGWRLLMPRTWRRLHRKLCVVDGQVAFCGGINLLDDYHDPNHGALSEPRLDFALRVTGPLVADVHDTMTRLWRRLQVVREAARRDLEAALGALRAVARAGLEERRGLSRLGGTDGVTAALVLRDNFRFRRRIEGAYRVAIAQARSEILIANAYFIPGVQLQRALLRAARRGVKITLLLQGRYEYFMQYHAGRAVYDRLLNAGIRVIEYEASFLHAKVAVMDAPNGAWSTVGSSNLDPLSLLLAREANVFARDDRLGDELRTRLRRAIEQQGREVEPASHRARPLKNRVLDWLAYALMRVALLVTGNRY